MPGERDIVGDSFVVMAVRGGWGAVIDNRGSAVDHHINHEDDSMWTTASSG